MVFAELLQSMMRGQKVSVSKLATDLKVPTQAVYGYLRKRIPSLKRTSEICEYFNVSVEAGNVARELTVRATDFKKAKARTLKTVPKASGCKAELMLVKRFRKMSKKNQKLLQALAYEMVLASRSGER